jgi:hypothetical protein
MVQDQFFRGEIHQQRLPTPLPEPSCQVYIKFGCHQKRVCR